jgi:hypothetical protein
MRYTKATLTVSALAALASAASAQHFSGSVDTLANVAGGSATMRTYATLAKGQTTLSMRLDNAGPGITGFGEAHASPGLLFARRNVLSSGIPYGQTWGKATYQDSVRWNGPTPVTVRVRAQLVGDIEVAGSIPRQTDASVYANFLFFAGPVNYSQTMQRSKTVEGTWDTIRGGIGDLVVTLQPGRWYSFNGTLQLSGDAADMTKLYTATSSAGYYGLKVWFELPSAGLGTLQSASGHDYTVEPVLPAVQ